MSVAAASSRRARLLSLVTEISRSPIFWVVLVLKLAAAALFGSDYLIHLFAPFIESFAASPFSNPYQTFWESGAKTSFPYPALMLFLEGLPRLLLQLMGVKELGLNASIFVYRLPLLMADAFILFVLCKWFRNRVQAFIWLYWACPVLFYISYVHGQLDVIPLSILFLFLYVLFSGHYILAAAILGSALAAKTNILVVLPLFLVFVWQSTYRKKLLVECFLITAAAFLAWNLPYLWSSGFLDMVFRNPEQSKIALAKLSFSDDDPAFYIIPGLLLSLVAYALHIHVHNRDILLTFIGFSFGSILLFVSPMPGWYYWIIPFFVYFFARMNAPYLALFGLLQFLYFCYFGLIGQSDYTAVLRLGNSVEHGGTSAALTNAGIDAQWLLAIVFTGLQTTLFLCCAVMYYRGIRIPQQHRLTARPFMIGIAGDSGAGKTTLSDSLQALFGERHLSVICGDDMHKWQRGHDRWKEFTHLDPRANELHNELHYLTALRQNKLVWRRHYDHSTGDFTEKLPIKAKPVMVMEGLHAFYLKPARDLYDLKIFVKPSEDLLLHRKVVRDMRKRNYTKETVLSAVKKRMADSKRYVFTQASYADIVISFSSIEPLQPEDIGNPEIQIKERLSIKLTNSFFLDPLLEDLYEHLPGSIHHHYGDNDLQVVEFDTPVSAEIAQMVGEKHLVGLQDFGVYEPQWLDGWQAQIQLILGYCIFHGWRDRD